MMKREFEQAYGRRVSDRRWQAIEQAYMASECLDRLEFVEEFKANEATRRFQNQAAKGWIELERHNVTETQFRTYIRKHLKGHPLEAWRDWITPELGHGDWEYRKTRHDWGATEINQDKDGSFQTYCKEDNGNCYNLIFEFDAYEDDGRGHGYPVANQINTAAVASNTGSKPGIVIIYMFLTANGEIDMAATTLDGPMPDGAIELARATVPAGNTEQNDPYLEKVTLADSSRREPNWPLVQRAPASIAVALNRSLPDNAYLVQVEIQSCKGGGLQVGEVRVRDKLKNGFKLVTNGTADDIQVRMLVEHPAI